MSKYLKNLLLTLALLATFTSVLLAFPYTDIKKDNKEYKLLETLDSYNLLEAFKGKKFMKNKEVERVELAKTLSEFIKVSKVLQPSNAKVRVLKKAKKCLKQLHKLSRSVTNARITMRRNQKDMVSLKSYLKSEKEKLKLRKNLLTFDGAYTTLFCAKQHKEDNIDDDNMAGLHKLILGLNIKIDENIEGYVQYKTLSRFGDTLLQKTLQNINYAYININNIWNGNIKIGRQEFVAGNGISIASMIDGIKYSCIFDRIKLDFMIADTNKETFPWNTKEGFDLKAALLKLDIGGHVLGFYTIYDSAVLGFPNFVRNPHYIGVTLNSNLTSKMDLLGEYVHFSNPNRNAGTAFLIGLKSMVAHNASLTLTYAKGDHEFIPGRIEYWLSPIKLNARWQHTNSSLTTFYYAEGEDYVNYHEQGSGSLQGGKDIKAEINVDATARTNLKLIYENLSRNVTHLTYEYDMVELILKHQYRENTSIFGGFRWLDYDNKTFNLMDNTGGFKKVYTGISVNF